MTRAGSPATVPRRFTGSRLPKGHGNHGPGPAPARPRPPLLPVLGRRALANHLLPSASRRTANRGIDHNANQRPRAVLRCGHPTRLPSNPSPAVGTMSQQSPHFTSHSSFHGLTSLSPLYMTASPSYPLGLPPFYPNDPHFYSVYTLNVGSVTLSPRACIPNEDDPVGARRPPYLVANVAARPAFAYKGTEAARRIIES
jgi:hypothetical protein